MSVKRESTNVNIAASSIILDIEGTTTSISFVKDVLFPHVRKHLEAFVNDNWDSEDFQNIMRSLKIQAKEDEEKNLEGLIQITENAEKEAIVKSVIENVLWQMDNDRKTKSLKDLQGMIMEEGYKKGDLKGHIYDDVETSLKSWSELGKSIYIYSSGSVHAQKLLFGNTEKGDLLPFIKGHFDTSVGMKSETESYKKIVEEMSCNPSEVAFLTDIPKEARAAKETGIMAILLSREGNAPLTDEDAAEFPVINSFLEIEFDHNIKKRKICNEKSETSDNKSLADCGVSVKNENPVNPKQTTNNDVEMMGVEVGPNEAQSEDKSVTTCGVSIEKEDKINPKLTTNKDVEMMEVEVSPNQEIGTNESKNETCLRKEEIKDITCDENSLKEHNEHKVNGSHENKDQEQEVNSSSDLKTESICKKENEPVIQANDGKEVGQSNGANSETEKETNNTCTDKDQVKTATKVEDCNGKFTEEESLKDYQGKSVDHSVEETVPNKTEGDIEVSQPEDSLPKNLNEHQSENNTNSSSTTVKEYSDSTIGKVPSETETKDCKIHEEGKIEIINEPIAVQNTKKSSEEMEIQKTMPLKTTNLTDNAPKEIKTVSQINPPIGNTENVETSSEKKEIESQANPVEITETKEKTSEKVERESKANFSVESIDITEKPLEGNAIVQQSNNLISEEEKAMPKKSSEISSDVVTNTLVSEPNQVLMIEDQKHKTAVSSNHNQDSLIPVVPEAVDSLNNYPSNIESRLKPKVSETKLDSDQSNGVGEIKEPIKVESSIKKDNPDSNEDNLIVKSENDKNSEVVGQSPKKVAVECEAKMSKTESMDDETETKSQIVELEKDKNAEVVGQGPDKVAVECVANMSKTESIDVKTETKSQIVKLEHSEAVDKNTDKVAVECEANMSKTESMDVETETESQIMKLENDKNAEVVGQSPDKVAVECEANISKTESMDVETETKSQIMKLENDKNPEAVEQNSEKVAVKYEANISKTESMDVETETESHIKKLENNKTPEAVEKNSDEVAESMDFETETESHIMKLKNDKNAEVVEQSPDKVAVECETNMSKTESMDVESETKSQIMKLENNDNSKAAEKNLDSVAVESNKIKTESMSVEIQTKSHVEDVQLDSDKCDTVKEAKTPIDKVQINQADSSSEKITSVDKCDLKDNTDKESQVKQVQDQKLDDPSKVCDIENVPINKETNVREADTPIEKVKITQIDSISEEVISVDKCDRRDNIDKESQEEPVQDQKLDDPPKVCNIENVSVNQNTNVECEVVCDSKVINETETSQKVEVNGMAKEIKEDSNTKETSFPSNEKTVDADKEISQSTIVKDDMTQKHGEISQNGMSSDEIPVDRSSNTTSSPKHEKKLCDDVTETTPLEGKKCDSSKTSSKAAVVKA